MVRTIFFCSRECRVVLDRLRALYPRLILDGIEDFVNREPQRSEVLFHLEGLNWIQWEDQEHMSFVGWLPPIRITGIDWGFVLRLQLLSVIAAFERLIDRAFHCFLHLDVRLGSEHNSLIWVTSCFNKCLHKGWEISNPLMNASTWHLHRGWEPWCAGSGYNRCRIEIVALSHFDGEEVILILLGLPTGGILGEKHLDYLLEIVKRMRRQRIKPIWWRTIQNGRKGQANERIVT